MEPFKGVSTNIFSMFTVNRDIQSAFLFETKLVTNLIFIERILIRVLRLAGQKNEP